MMAQIIDRKRLKEDTRQLLGTAQVNPKAMAALYLGICLVLDVMDQFIGGNTLLPSDRNLIGLFAFVLVQLLSAVLAAGFVLYCMAIRRGERAGFLTLFDGFSFVGRLIALSFITMFFVFLWSMLFVVPGIIAAYRYRFALYNLYENPGLTPLEALNMSKAQTVGYKIQLFMLDLSYLGWVILASLPTMFTSSQAAVAAMSGEPADAVLYAWTWSLVCTLWSSVVALFYLPNYQCVELGYFEIAKSTSGVGLGSTNPGADGC